jgi:hypothetical protein
MAPNPLPVVDRSGNQWQVELLWGGPQTPNVVRLELLAIDNLDLGMGAFLEFDVDILAVEPAPPSNPWQVSKHTNPSFANVVVIDIEVFNDPQAGESLEFEVQLDSAPTSMTVHHADVSVPLVTSTFAGAPTADCDGDGWERESDCNDARADIYPFAPEACDLLDNDCDHVYDEGFNVGDSCSDGVGECEQFGQIECAPDGSSSSCNATAGSPDPEICDGLDNDCDGTPDDGNPGGGASCGTGLPGVCADGVENCTVGTLVCEPLQSPTSESCDGLDNDCNDEVDEGLEIDDDGDGLFAFGSCLAAPPYDCDDSVSDPTNSCNSTPSPDPVTFEDPTGNASVELPNVTSLGNTTVTEITSCTLDLPAGFTLNLADLCYDVDSTAGFSGYAEICITADLASIPDPPGTGALVVMSCDDAGGNCAPITTSFFDIDLLAVPPTVTMCGITDQLSWKALVVNTDLTDSDFDGWVDATDNCPNDFNPSQFNSDHDFFGNACDNCPYVSNAPQTPSAQYPTLGCACLCGDANRDCRVNVGDAPEAQRAGLVPPLPPLSPLFDVNFCDINGDGSCNVADAPEMQRAGLVPPLPPISPNFSVTGCSGYLGPNETELLLEFDDPVGDDVGRVDVTKMEMRFDSFTGDYEIKLFATAAEPFLGDFRVNINLYNQDLGTSA